MVVRYCRARLGRITGHYYVADDVAQEVCLAVLAALPRYRDMGRPFASFVFGIASHKVADAVRNASGSPSLTRTCPTARMSGPGRKRPWWPALSRNVPGRSWPSSLITYVSC